MEATTTRSCPTCLTSQAGVQQQETLNYLVRQASDILCKLTKLDDLSSMSDRSRKTLQTCQQIFSALDELHNLCIDNLSDNVKNTSINVDLLVQNLHSVDFLTLQNGLRNVDQTGGGYDAAPHSSNVPRSAAARRLSLESLNIDEEIEPNDEMNPNLGYLSEILQTVHNLNRSTKKIMELTDKGFTKSAMKTEEEIENVKKVLTEVRHIHDIMRGFDLDSLRGFCERVEGKFALLTGEQYSREQQEQTHNLMVQVLSVQEQLNEKLDGHQKLFEFVADFGKKLIGGAERTSSIKIVDESIQETASEMSVDSTTKRTPLKVSPNEGTNRTHSEVSLDEGTNRRPSEVSPDEDTNRTPSEISSGVLTHEALLMHGATSEHGGSKEAAIFKDDVISDAQEQTCLMTTEIFTTKKDIFKIIEKPVDDNCTGEISAKDDLATPIPIATEELIIDVESVTAANKSLDDLATETKERNAEYTTDICNMDQNALMKYVAESLQQMKKEICQEIITSLKSSKSGVMELQKSQDDQDERQAARIIALEKELDRRLVALENSATLHSVQLDTMVSRVDQTRETLRKKIEVHAPSYVKLLLIGSPGVGKSAVGNSILGRNVFVSMESREPVTADIEVASGKQDGRFVTVVDTPGINLRDKQWNEWNRLALHRAASVVPGGYKA